jgi:hypothetical protein
VTDELHDIPMRADVPNAELAGAGLLRGETPADRDRVAIVRGENEALADEVARREARIS